MSHPGAPNLADSSKAGAPVHQPSPWPCPQGISAPAYLPALSCSCFYTEYLTALRASETQGVPLTASFFHQFPSRQATCVYKLLKSVKSVVSVLHGPFSQAPFDFNSTGALVLLQTSGWLSCGVHAFSLNCYWKVTGRDRDLRAACAGGWWPGLVTLVTKPQPRTRETLWL